MPTTIPTNSTVCPVCNSSDVRFIEKKNGWRCQDCDTLFHTAGQQVFTPQNIFLSYAHQVEGNDDDSAVLVEEIQKRLVAAKHSAWIDREQLHPGAEWRQGITEGILASDRVLSFLSPRSVRDPGVCLDEIGIAMGVKHGAIATLLCDARVRNSSPASVTHIQYLDLSDWRAVRAQGDAIWEPWITDKTAQILDIIARNTGFAGEIAELARVLHPLPINARIGALVARGFVGRQWVLQHIEDWRLHAPQQKLFWLKAGPGMGKSAIAAHLAHFVKTQTVAVHFCDYTQPESRSAARFVHNLAFMLAARLADYRTLLGQELQLLGKPLAQFDAQELMHRLVLEPLCQKIDGGLSGDRLLVVVDALDEAEQELPALLAQTMDAMPDWLGFVVTCRPETGGVLARFQHMELSMDDSRNLQDLNTFMDQWLGTPAKGSAQHRVRQALLQASQGNMLYLVFAREAARTGQWDVSQMPSFPVGIGGLYRQWMVRQFGEQPRSNPDWTGKSYPLLELVCASPQPLPLKWAGRLLGWKGQDRVDAMEPLGSLLELRDYALALCHRSLSEWLQDEAGQPHAFWVNTEQARLTLAQALLEALPASLEDREPGYLHLALPALLAALPMTDCQRLCGGGEGWRDLAALLFRLDALLDGHYSRAAGDSLLQLRQFLSDGSRSLLGPQDPLALIFMGNLALALAAQGQRKAALRMQQEILDSYLHTVGESDPATLASMNNLALTLSDLGLHGAATAQNQKALALRQRVCGVHHVDTLTSMNNLAASLSAQEQWAQAQALNEEVLAVRRQTLGTHHPDTLASLNNLARVHLKQGHLAEARDLQEQALASASATPGVPYRDVLTCQENLAATLVAQDDWEAARTLQEQALRGRMNALPKGHPDILSAIYQLLSTLQQQGDWQALPEVQELALDELLQAHGLHHPDTMLCMKNLANAHANLGEWTAARHWFEQTLALMTTLLGETDPQTLECRELLAMLPREDQGDSPSP